MRKSWKEIILENYPSVIFKQVNGTIKILFKCTFPLNDLFHTKLREIQIILKEINPCFDDIMIIYLLGFCSLN